MTLEYTQERKAILSRARQKGVFVLTPEAFQRLKLLEYSASLPTFSSNPVERVFATKRRPLRGTPTVDPCWLIAEVSQPVHGFVDIRWTAVVFDGPPIEWSRAFL